MIKYFHTTMAFTAMESIAGNTSLADVAKVAELIHVEAVATLNRFFMQKLDGVGGIDFGCGYPQNRRN